MADCFCSVHQLHKSPEIKEHGLNLFCLFCRGNSAFLDWELWGLKAEWRGGVWIKWMGWPALTQFPPSTAVMGEGIAFQLSPCWPRGRLLLQPALSWGMGLLYKSSLMEVSLKVAHKEGRRVTACSGFCPVWVHLVSFRPAYHFSREGVGKVKVTSIFFMNTSNVNELEGKSYCF